MRRSTTRSCASVFPRSSSQSGEADAPQDLRLALLVNHMRRQPHASVPLLSRDAVTRRLRVERNAIGFEERRHERLHFILARDRLGNAAEDRAGPWLVDGPDQHRLWCDRNDSLQAFVELTERHMLQMSRTHHFLATDFLRHNLHFLTGCRAEPLA